MIKPGRRHHKCEKTLLPDKYNQSEVFLAGLLVPAENKIMNAATGELYNPPVECHIISVYSLTSDTEGNKALVLLPDYTVGCVLCPEGAASNFSLIMILQHLSESKIPINRVPLVLELQSGEIAFNYSRHSVRLMRKMAASKIV